ncbi:3-oxoacyl-[acyl-carrier protein] reductase [Natronocella acetinitrilica]|uniref:3-oxoacyl-[acyl-carrier protein] reductase n=1 Tax=Natronocella acetinitrilica TaxID=414046 RepID=A0AAE3G6T3_9GAMM|nr:SDR family oxidoreductase [Natronocella acetinitrilica]MCP1676487.1 3-oxoacyl-[acyl-carrier protein] reductase [Natronocella acetinitrilica]
MRLNGKVAVVTGGGSGFGEAIARRFAGQGARVVVADINLEGAERVAEAIAESGGEALAVRTDVSQNDDMASLVESTVSRFGTLHVMVNNAGTTHRNGPMLDVDEDTFDRVYAVNVKSIYLSARHVVPVFRRQGSGCFINVASTAGVRPRPGLTWYNGSKGAAVILTKSMAVELGPEQIRVNAINPVMGETGLIDQFLGDNSREAVISGIPMGRLSQPSDIASAALFLASDDAAFITGVCLEVDGGRCV